MVISTIVRAGAMVAAAALLGGCTSGSGGQSPASTTTQTATTAPSSSAPATAGAPVTSSAAAPETQSAGSTVASSKTSFGVTYVSVTSNWTGQQVFSKPRSDGSPAVPATYGSGVLATFTSPSGNISCQIQVDTPEGSSDGAVCQISAHAYLNPAPAAGATCTSGYGDAVQLLPSGVKVECPAPAKAPSNPAGAALPAGSQLDFGGVTCLSTTYGIRCLDDKQQVGFMIGKDILAKIEP